MIRHLFLPDTDLRADAEVHVEGPVHHHLVHVLRVRVGEPLIVLDNAGSAYHAEVLDVDRRSLALKLLSPAEVAPEPSLHITVAQALGKGDKFDQVIQHATEAGAGAFLPLYTERTVVRPDPKGAAEKGVRWSLIARGAAEQAGRARIPSIEAACTLTALLPRFASYDLALLLDPKGETLEQALRGRWATAARGLILVGPEGGFAPGEIAAAQDAGARVVSLGPHTLRTETAAVVAVSQLLFGIRMSEELKECVETKFDTVLQAPRPSPGCDTRRSLPNPGGR